MDHAKQPAKRLEIVPDGKDWAVTKPGQPRPHSRYRFLTAAERAAQRLLGEEGGGELLFRDRDGVVRDTEIVAPACNTEIVAAA